MLTHRELEIAVEMAHSSLVPIDQLPYTPEFDRLYQAYTNRLGRPVTQSHFWRALTNVRKKGMVGKRWRSGGTTAN